MNLLDGCISTDGLFFQINDGPQLRFEQPISALAGQTLTLGIRPEHLRRAAEHESGSEFMVNQLELLGADNLAHSRWGIMV